MRKPRLHATTALCPARSHLRGSALPCEPDTDGCVRIIVVIILAALTLLVSSCYIIPKNMLISHVRSISSSLPTVTKKQQVTGAVQAETPASFVAVLALDVETRPQQCQNRVYKFTLVNNQ